MLPASNITSSPGLSVLDQVTWRKRSEHKFRQKCRFLTVYEREVLPKSSGRTMVFHRFRDGSASTTPAAEGAPTGSGLTLSANAMPVRLTQYHGYATISDVLDETSFIPVVNEAVDHLSYVAALTVDTICRANIDNSASSFTLTAGGTYLRASDLDAARAQLQVVDVEPREDGYFTTFMSPMVRYDILNDPGAAGYLDRYKYSMPDSNGLLKAEDRGVFGRINGCKIVELNRVYTSGSNYRTYIFGANMGSAVDLASQRVSDVVDANKNRFAVKVVRTPEGGWIGDIGGLVAAGAGYKFMFAAALTSGPSLIGGPYAVRVFDTPSSLG